MPVSSSVCRINRNQNYTVMSNYHLRSKNLSLKAIGLLSKVFSLRDDWDYSIAGLVSICKENETAVKSALNELKEWGYLTVTKTQNPETGRFVYIYDFFEYSEKDINCSVQNEKKTKISNGRKALSKSQSNGADTSSSPDIENLYMDSPASENPGIENPYVDNPSVENQGQLNTKESNIKKSITDKSITDNTASQKNSPAPSEKMKKKKYAESVLLFEIEYETLCNELGKDFTDECIEVLNNYKLANGKKYKSDYHAIRSWVISRVSQKYPNQKNNQNSKVKYYADGENPFADVM